MKIQTKNGDSCPICRRFIVPPNCWVRYHVSYTPCLVILACKNCNYIERALRLSLSVPFSRRSQYSPFRLTRAEMVINYMGKFGITYYGNKL